jgi:Protease inhibitor Inh
MEMNCITSKKSGRRSGFHLAAATLAAASLLAVEAAAAVNASAQTAPLQDEALAGQWDMSLGDTNRKCRLTLYQELAGKSHEIVMPAGCRRAMPILAAVGTWNTASDALVMINRDGEAALTFAPVEDGLAAKGPEGETYSLTAADPVKRRQFAQAPKPVVTDPPAPAAPAPAAPAAPKPPAAAAADVKPADIAGRYSVLREVGKETGCTITLDEKAKGPKGTLKALLAPACRDQGIVIFDPVGWSITNGRLNLTAKKGHQAHFDKQADGTWAKDAKEGKALMLRKQ